MASRKFDIMTEVKICLYLVFVVAFVCGFAGEYLNLKLSLT